MKAEKILGKNGVRNSFYGQEINITTYNFYRINMFLHDIDFDRFDIACDDTLTMPKHWYDEPFELIVSNPPLPPLEEQERIVNILDKFDKICNDIYEGIPAEIEAMQKQYEYYGTSF